MVPSSDPSVAFACPNCGQALNSDARFAEVVCLCCDQTIRLDSRLCPSCGAFHQDDTLLCERCGAETLRACPNCRLAVQSTDLLCNSCGHRLELDPVHELIARRGRTTSDRLTSQMREARALKQLESEASARRMAELQAIEDARLHRVRRQSELQWAREKRMLVAAITLATVAALALVAYFIISQYG